MEIISASINNKHHSIGFPAMTKHRKFLLLAAVVGVISMPLPWWTVCLYGICADSDNGFKYLGLIAGGGVVTAFLGTGALSFLGNKRKNLDLKQSAIALGCGGTAAAIILWYFNRHVSALGSSDLRIGIYLAAMAALAIPLSLVAVWFFKSSEADSE